MASIDEMPAAEVLGCVRTYVLSDPATLHKVMKEGVLKGMKLLDEKCPDWFDRLDIETLNDDPENIGIRIVEQLYGDVQKGYEALGIVGAMSQNGFACPLPTVEGREDLFKLWKQAFCMKLGIISENQFRTIC